MLRLGKLTDYAIVMLTAMADRDQPDQVLSATEIAAMTHLELTTVQKILKALTKSGLILSYRGVKGGYRLAHDPARTTVAAIIAAMEGPIGMTECSITPGTCTQEAYCQVQSNWRRISRAVEKSLEGITLSDMIAPPPTTGDFPIRIRIANL